jgi:uncharacterized membrane protein
VTFAQPLPWWALLLALAVIAFVAWRAGWLAGAAAAPPATRPQRLALVALRAATLVALVVLAMRPVRLLPDPAARGTLAVLLDTSRSMALTDAESRSRLETATALIRNRVAPALEGRLAMEILAFGDDVQAISIDQLSRVAATQPATDLDRALEAVRRRAAARPVAGLLVLSDGGFSLPATETAGDLAPPIYTLGVGSAVVARDREVRQLTAGDASVAGATVDLTATLVSAGFGSRPIEVRLSASGTPLDVRRVASGGEGVPLEVVFRVAPDAAAATLYTVEATPQEGELTAENNRRSLLVNPPGRARRVLLLEGRPGFEHSFLKRALDQDKALELDAVVRKGPNEAGEQTFYVQAPAQRGPALTNGFPASRQSLFVYDALVLANLETDALTGDQLALVGEYVGERGGGLLVLGARSFDPEAVSGTVLEELLPVEISDRRASGLARAELSSQTASGTIVLSADGERHPIMRLGATADETRNRWAKLPKLASVASVGGARPGATVLAFADGPGGISRPLVAVQRYGRGRVLAFAGEGAWRWRMMLPSTDTTYPTFWRQATRWLAAAAPDPLQIRTRVTGPGRLEIAVDARDENFRPVRDAAVRLQVRGADDKTQTVTATPVRDADGTFAAEVRVPSGVTRIEARAVSKGAVVGQATAWGLAGADDRELVEPRRNDAQLARLAERHGGRLITPDEVGAVVRDVSARASAATALREQDVWHSPWVLLLLLGLLGAEWTLRRRWGLR